MINRDVYRQDPLQFSLLNDGVASVSGAEEDLRTLQFELRTFVCEGEYEKGMARILHSYLEHVDKPKQPAVWISGFWGSGKSHLAKMLRYLWTDYTFPDKSTARGIARLPTEIQDLLKELSTRGRQYGGLQAAAGTLRAGTSGSVQLAVLGILFHSLGLPEDYAAARFMLWLRDHKMLDAVRASLKAAGKNLDTEVRHLYVSTPLAEAVAAADPKLPSKPADMLAQIKAQFPPVKDVSISDMVHAVRAALQTGPKLPCTIVILDELQQFIGEDNDRAYGVQLVVEAISEQLDGKIMVVGTGQASLTSTSHLSKLKGRFTRNVQLSDNDVDAVIRQVVLAKRPDCETPIHALLDSCKGEISRHLVGTKIEPRPEDDTRLVPDYPLLPVRSRFWDRAIRAVDSLGLSGQLRTRLKIAFEAAKATANEPLGHVVPADFMFDQSGIEMVQTGALDRELYNFITQRQTGDPDDQLTGRICALVFLIGKLPRETGDLGIRATADMLADLLVSDLTSGSAELRRRIPGLLEKLVEQGRLMQIESEYRLQTQETTKWEMEYRQRYAKVLADDGRIAQTRADLVRQEVAERLKGVKLLQGRSKAPRDISLTFSDEWPDEGDAVAVWVRSEWDAKEKTILDDARSAGVNRAFVTVLIPRRAPEDIKKAIASWKAAQETIDTRGTQTTREGEEAHTAMQSRANLAQNHLRAIFSDQVVPGIKIILAGGQEFDGLEISARVQDAATAAAARLYPEFNIADRPVQEWRGVQERVRKGSGTPLDAVGYNGNAEQHPVCSAVLSHVGSGKKGTEIRKHFESPPYGWPRDAVDAALMVLVAAGHLRASHAGRDVEKGKLDQAKIAATDFRIESTTVSAQQRIALRALFQSLGVKCDPNEESARAPEVLKRLLDLAGSAGGEVPLPARPNTAHMQDMQALAGNDQLVAIYDARDRLTAEAKQWQAAGEAAKRRLPRWENLTRMAAHATGLPGAEGIQTQINAVTRNRSLLADPDPVPPLCSELAELLRTTLVEAHTKCQQRYEAEFEKRAASDAWRKLPESQRPEIAAQCKIKPIPDIRVGTEEELLDELDARSINGWRELCDALPSRFAEAAMLAAKCLEPKAVRVSLPSATIKTEKELDEWLTAVRDTIRGQLEKGPVILS